jgi:hypothetical protein
MYVAVGGATGAGEIEAGNVGLFVADPVFPVGTYDDFDGAGAGLGDAISDVPRASLGHDVLLVRVKE